MKNLRKCALVKSMQGIAHSIGNWNRNRCSVLWLFFVPFSVPWICTQPVYLGWWIWCPLGRKPQSSQFRRWNNVDCINFPTVSWVSVALAPTYFVVSYFTPSTCDWTNASDFGETMLSAGGVDMCSLSDWLNWATKVGVLLKMFFFFPHVVL